MSTDKEPAEGSRETADEALRRRDQGQQGITNRPLDEEKRQQEKLPPRGDGMEEDESTPGSDMRDMRMTPEGQSSGGKTGTRSDARKHASASRGGKAPGKARAKAGASGTASRRPTNTGRTERGTIPAAGVEWTERPRS